MKYKIVESVEKKENINNPVDDNFTLSEELLNIKSEKINESVETENPIEEDYNYSEYDKKLLVNRAKSIAKAIYDLYNSDQVEAQGELPSAKEIAEDLLKEPKKIDMYAKFLSKIAGTKKVKNYTEKLIQELASFKKKLSLMKPQTSECLMKVRDIKEGKEIDRQVFASLEKLNDGGYSILNDGYFVARVSADDDDDAKAVFKKFLNSDWKKAWKDGTLPKYANDWLDGNVNESLDESSDMRSEYVMDDSQMDEWNQICKAFAKKLGAKLVFVNETSCGLEFPDGSMQHVYIDEMVNYLGGMNESINENVFKEWKPNTSFNHIKKVFNDIKNRGFKPINNEREEILAAVDKADKNGYTPEQCRMIWDWHKQIWQANRNKNESLLMEKAVPEEDKYENDLIKSIIRKRRDRANAKLTPEEQEVFNKYNLSIYPDKTRDRYWDRYRHKYEYGPITTDNKTKVGRRFISSKDTWGVGAKDGKHDVNYVDMARKAPERINRETETGIKGNYSQWGLGGSRERYTDATQQLRNKINRDAEKDYRAVSTSLRNRNYYKKSIDSTNKYFDDEKNRILKRNLERVTKEIADNESRRSKDKEYSQTKYDDATSEINNILNKHRKNKQESFKRVPKRSINESKVSDKRNNNG